MNELIEHSEYPEKRCCFQDHGMPCGRYGTISLSTKGWGQWYCRDHAWATLGDSGHMPQHPKRDETQEDIDARVNKLVPRIAGESEHDWSMRCKAWAVARIMQKVPGTYWAKQILKRKGRGEQLPYISTQLAEEILRVGRQDVGAVEA
jgi:hypothetical protein